MTVLSARVAYRLWAPRYDAETAVSHLETEAVAALGVVTRGRTLLDAGCGTGRRLRRADARLAVGVDLSPEMLAYAPADRVFAAADVTALPFPDSSFDVVWCRLVLGHVRALGAAYAELARVCRPGGTVVVSDIAAEAARAGHARTFRDAGGAVREIEHFVYPAATHIAAASDADLAWMARRDGVVGASVRRYYAAAGREAMYLEQQGMPLVVALSFRRARP